MKVVKHKEKRIAGVTRSKLIKKYNFDTDVMFGCRFCHFGSGKTKDLSCSAPGDLDSQCGDLDVIWMSKKEYAKYIVRYENLYADEI